MERVRRIETWARLGYVARGVVYILLGWIALSSGKALSTGETVQAFDDLPGGDLILILILLATGLFGYGLYKIYSGAVDLDDKGSDAKGWVVRASRVIGGIGYWVLAFIAARQIGGQDSAAETGTSAGSDGTKQQAAEQISQAAGGDLLLALIGAGVLAMAAAQFWIASLAMARYRVIRDEDVVARLSQTISQ